MLPLCSHSAALVLSNSMDNLHGNWQFKTDPNNNGEREGWRLPAYNDKNWQALAVPAAWESQGITEYDGIAWYRLRFTVPASWAGQELVLSMPSIDDMDRTFFNGKLIGETGKNFKVPVLVQRRYKIKPALVRPGKENVLAVRVFDGGGPGGISGSPVFLLPLKSLSVPLKLPTADRPLAARFANPPANARILKIIHSWPDAAEAQSMLIRSLISTGFGGVVSNVSFTDYLKSEDRWKDFVRAVTAAKKSGMTLWIYDEKGYPSGTAGGLTMQGHPEWEVQGLLSNDTVTNGELVNVKVPSGKLILAVAFPESQGQIDPSKPIDLSSSISNQQLTWQAPAGRWHIMVVTNDRLFDHTYNSASLGDKLPYINLLMPEPTARFIELTHQAYANHLGDDLGKWFVSTFTDEPSLMNSFLPGSEFRGLPWAPNLPTEFKKRHGYDIEPLIPLLLAESGSKGKKVRYDFWQTIGELVSENYFGQIQEFCHKHNFFSGGHLVQEEPILDNVACYGNFFSCIRRLDAPSMDCLTSSPPEVPWQDARLISSIAELGGKTVTMCETSDFGQVYRTGGDKRPLVNVTESEIRGTCNRLMLGGINTITSYYTFNGITGEQLRRINDWVGRCNTMLAGGYRTADIAVLYPAESIWPKFVPARVGPSDSAAANQVSQAYDAVTATLYAADRDFSYVDVPALEKATIDKGAFTHGDLNWRVLVLPAVDTLPVKIWEKIAEFWKSGGVVIAAGALPQNSESEFPSAHVTELATEIFGNPTGISVQTNPAGGVAIYMPKGSESMLATVIDTVLEKDIKLPGSRTPIRSTHRRINGYDLYFVINDSAAPWEGTVDLLGNGPGENWDPATGKTTAIKSAKSINLKLEPYGGTIYRFKSAKKSQRITAASGVISGPVSTPLPIVEPAIAAGEFVRATVESDKSHSTSEIPAWHTSATITRSKVDTFSMLAFNYPKALDLSKAEYISIDAWMPEDQTIATKLLMIIRDSAGAEYYVDTGISLNSAGHNQVSIPINRLQPAPWATGKGELNLKSINTIVVGWGGYLGTEGEKLDYTLAIPQTGVMGK